MGVVNNKIIKKRNISVTIDTTYGVGSLYLNKSDAFVTSLTPIGEAVQVSIYENIGGDYFAYCPSAKGKTLNLEVGYFESFQ